MIHFRVFFLYSAETFSWFLWHFLSIERKAILSTTIRLRRNIQTNWTSFYIYINLNDIWYYDDVQCSNDMTTKRRPNDYDGCWLTVMSSPAAAADLVNSYVLAASILFHLYQTRPYLSNKVREQMTAALHALMMTSYTKVPTIHLLEKVYKEKVIHIKINCPIFLSYFFFSYFSYFFYDLNAKKLKPLGANQPHTCKSQAGGSKVCHHIMHNNKKRYRSHLWWLGDKNQARPR